MENAQKAIMIGVGLFITIIIIAAVMLITGMGQNLLNQGQAQINGMSESLRNDLFQQYDGKKLSGAQVRSAAVQLVNRDDASAITIYIGEKKEENKVDSTAKVNEKITNTTKMYTGTVEQDAEAGTVTITWK